MNIIEKLGITPGPWSTWYDGPTSGDLDIVLSGKETIGFIYNNKEPDARLIATAPEMLEMLIRAAKVIDYPYPSHIAIIEKATDKSWDEVKALME